MPFLFIAAVAFGLGLFVSEFDWLTVRNWLRWRWPLAVTIRPATASDSELLTKLVVDFHASQTGAKVDNQAAERFRARRAQKDWPLDVFLAEHDGKVAGFVGLQLFALNPAFSQSLHVSELYVLPEFRSRGVGRKLMDRARAEARERGHAMLYWSVLAKSAGAVRLYESIPNATRYGHNYAVVISKPVPSQETG